jgi:hypothetical protein
MPQSRSWTLGDGKPRRIGAGVSWEWLHNVQWTIALLSKMTLEAFHDTPKGRGHGLQVGGDFE